MRRSLARGGGAAAAAACAASLAAWALVVACGSSAGDAPSADAGDDGPPAPRLDAGDAAASGDADNGAPSTTYPAFPPDPPRLVNTTGGKVLATPAIYLVTYPGYAHTSELVDLATTIGATSYWTSATSEYGVGAVTFAGATELTGETPPATISADAAQSYLAGKLAGGAFGAPDPNAIYTIVYPAGTSITFPNGGKSCNAFGGYHTSFALGDPEAGPTTNIAYAVLPTCGTFQGLGEADALTGAASHEWIEAVTDPFPGAANGQDAAFSTVDDAHVAWLFTGLGGEAGDLCVDEPDAFFVPTGLAHIVQRTWSNGLALAGHDPCAPDLAGHVYFDSVPVLPDTFAVDIGTKIQAPGVLVAEGQSRTIEVDLASDAAIGPWTVSAGDELFDFGTGPETLGFAWDRTTGQNGEKLHLTITVKQSAEIHAFVIRSSLGSARRERFALVSEP